MNLSRYSFRSFGLALCLALSALAAPMALTACAEPAATAVAGVNTQIGVGISGLAAAESVAADLKTAGKITEAQAIDFRTQATGLRKTLTDLRAAGGVDTANVLPVTLQAIVTLQNTLNSLKGPAS